MDLEEAVAKTYGEVLKLLGYKSRGGNTYQKIRKQINDLGYNTSHFFKDKYTDATIFVQNSTYKNMAKLKKKILERKLIPYKCSVCGNTGTWQGEKLSLQLHHINGNNSDHRICNLAFLCPNCHTQTENYGSKNM